MTFINRWVWVVPTAIILIAFTLGAWATVERNWLGAGFCFLAVAVNIPALFRTVLLVRG